MRVAIVNFSMDNYKDLEEAMEKLIAESQCYLFTIVLSNLQTAGGGMGCAQWRTHIYRKRYYS